MKLAASSKWRLYLLPREILIVGENSSHLSMILESSKINMAMVPAAMDKHLDFLDCHQDGGIVLGASNLTGRYWLGSLWYFDSVDLAPQVEHCKAGAELEAGVCEGCWIDLNHIIAGLDSGVVQISKVVLEDVTFETISRAKGHDDIITGISVFSDRTTAVSCCEDGSVRVWDLPSLSTVSSYKAHSEMALCVNCHPSEPQLFLSCSRDGRVLLWDRRKLKPATNIASMGLLPTCVAWQPDGKDVLAIGDELGQIIIKDVRQKVPHLKHGHPHNRSLYRVSFSPLAPTWLASIAHNCDVIVTDVELEQPLNIYFNSSHTDFVRGLSWKDSELITCGWDTRVLCHNLKKLMKEDTIQTNAVETR